MKRLLWLWLPGWLAAGAALAQPQPQPIQDPTRPPAQLQQRAAAVQAAPPARLQSILVAGAPAGRRVAVIDGVMVRVGDLVGGARVIRIGQTSVQLARAGQPEVLTLGAPGAAPEIAAPPGAKPEKGSQ